MDYYDNWGLLGVNIVQGPQDNNMLYAIEHQFLTNSIAEQIKLEECLNISRVSNGIYLQHPSGDLTNDDAYVSRDNLIAMVGFSYKYDLSHHKEIWAEIKRQWLRYNNVISPHTFWEKATNKRMLQIPDLIFFGYCAGSWICKLLLPLLFISMIMSSICLLYTSPSPRD